MATWFTLQDIKITLGFIDYIKCPELDREVQYFSMAAHRMNIHTRTSVCLTVYWPEERANGSCCCEIGGAWCNRQVQYLRMATCGRRILTRGCVRLSIHCPGVAITCGFVGCIAGTWCDRQVEDFCVAPRGRSIGTTLCVRLAIG